MSDMKVLVCGDRNWSSESVILERLSKLPAGTTVIEGGARGADQMAGAIARRLGLPVVEVPANWGLHGRAAGPIRNRKMLDMSPTLVIAFHPDLAKSKGTADTVREAGRRGIPAEVIGL
jgi:hypothetical protein